MLTTYTAKYAKISARYMGQLVEWLEKEIPIGGALEELPV